MSEGNNLLQPRVGARTDVGKVRSENQDRMGRFASRFGDLFIVVDGMGGHKGGAAAAAMAIDGLEGNLDTIPDGTPPPQAIQEAAQKTNAAIYSKATDGDPETAKMGATLVLGLLRNGHLITAHAGDSRAYLFRAGKLMRLTRDHSVVQEMIDHSMLTEEEARDHPDASVITRAFGQKPELEIEVGPPLPLREGDGILLCTDGLCGYLPDQAIESTISRNEDAQQVADDLIDLALSAGGEDNVTVQFLQFGVRENAPIAVGRETAPGSARIEVPLGSVPRPAANPPDAERSQAPKLFLLLVAVLMVALAAGAAGIWFYPSIKAALSGFHNQNGNQNRNANTESGNRNAPANQGANANDNSPGAAPPSPEMLRPEQAVTAPQNTGGDPSANQSQSQAPGSQPDQQAPPATDAAPPSTEPEDISALVIDKPLPKDVEDWLSQHHVHADLRVIHIERLPRAGCVYYMREATEPLKQTARELADKLQCEAREMPPELMVRLKNDLTKHDLTIRP